QQLVGYFEAERLSGLEIDHQLELCRLFDRQVRGLGALQDLVHVAQHPASSPSGSAATKMSSTSTKPCSTRSAIRPPTSGRSAAPPWPSWSTICRVLHSSVRSPKPSPWATLAAGESQGLLPGYSEGFQVFPPGTT